MSKVLLLSGTPVFAKALAGGECFAPYLLCTRITLETTALRPRTRESVLLFVFLCFNKKQKKRKKKYKNLKMNPGNSEILHQLRKCSENQNLH